MGRDPYYRETHDKQWRVCKVTVMGQESYEVWQRLGEDRWRQVQVKLPTMDAAKRVIEGGSVREYGQL